jgi:probable HAF family extracellular repeat protein
MKQGILLFALSTCLLIDTSFSGPVPHRPNQYRVTRFDSFAAIRINNRGQIAGNQYDSSGLHAVLYSDGVLYNLQQFLPYHVPFSQFLDLTEDGKVLISAGTNYFIIENGQATSFEQLFGTNSAVPISINSGGQIVGEGWAPNGTLQAFLYAGGVVSFLGGFPGAPHIKWSDASRISEHGDIAGNAYNDHFELRAVIFSPQGIVDVTLGQCLDINKHGHAAGFSVGQDRTWRGFLWKQGQLTVFPTPTNSYSSAEALNNNDEIVGIFNQDLAPLTRNQAILFTDGVMHILDDLIEPDPDWELQVAKDINDRGEIVGFGYYRRSPQWFLLTPLKGNASRR